MTASPHTNTSPAGAPADRAEDALPTLVKPGGADGSTSAPQTAAAAGAAVGSDDPEDEYRVGYKRPPRKACWKKGQSGNPAGRPKGARSIKSELRDELDRVVSVREGGRTMSMPARRAVAKRVVEKAMQGDVRWMMYLLENDPLLAEEERAAAQEEGDPAYALTPDDAAVLQAFLQRIGGRAENPEAAEVEASR